MKRVAPALAGLLLAAPAAADMYQDAGNAKLPEAMVKLLSGGALVGPVSIGYPGGQPRIYGHGSSFGTTSGGGIFSAYTFNNVDTADCSSAAGCYGVYSGYTFGGGTVKGNRTGSFTLLNMTAPTGNASGPTSWYTATGAESRANTADGGTPTVPKGDVFAANYIATMTGTAENMNALVGMELDVSAGGLGAPAYKAGLSIVQQTTDKYQATQDDVALQINNQFGGTAPGWKVGYGFGGHTGWWPIAATGTMIGTVPNYPGGPSPAAAYGVDFSQVTFSGASFKSVGFQVNGAGEVIVTLPTSCTGKPAGTLRNNAGVVNVCP